jgi:predicted aspartyl protease
VAQLSEWLQIMLAEIARKQYEAQLAAEEHERRLASSALTPASASASIPAPSPAPAPERIHAL